MNDLYGIKFIEKQRSSGYKSTIYAMAEIVDNAVDAQASKIDIVFVEDEFFTGARKHNRISEIYFIDNGTGMAFERINSCLTFSEGDGRSDSRIGAFGVGLPNSSISVGRRVDVYSKDENDHWNYVFLDLDDQELREKPGYDPAIKKDPNFDKLIKIDTKVRTVIKWSKLDRLDASRAETIINRAKKLLGRIYRYQLIDELKIELYSFLKGNSSYSVHPFSIIPYDPLFVMTKKNYITEYIWKWSESEDPAGKHKVLGDDPEFNSMYHYKKFTTNCIKNETTLPIFQKFEDYWDVPYEVTFGSKKYKWRIKASFANASIANPGVRSGGATKIGKIFGEKMSGSNYFKSGNVFFLRANREIDYGNFGLYTVTNEKNRFWTIEIHFNGDLDDLMGISNNKQSVEFQPIQNSDIDFHNIDEDAPLGQQREILWAQMTETVKRCIKGMTKQLNEYARNFKDKEKLMIEAEEGEKTPIPQAETAVIEVIPKGGEWSEEEKEEISNFLKEKYMHLSKEVIDEQVEIFAKGLTKTIVLYAPNETNNLFELKEKRGKLITFINTNHIYYINVLEPLKSNKRLRIFAIAIEMLISSFAIEMDRLINDNESKYKQSLDTYLLQLSSRLNEFIHDGHIRVVPEEYEKQLLEEIENEINE